MKSYQSVKGIIEDDNFFAFFSMVASDGTTQTVAFDQDKIEEVESREWRIMKMKEPKQYRVESGGKEMFHVIFHWSGPDEHHCICFVDGNRLNNCVHNLRSPVHTSARKPNGMLQTFENSDLFVRINFPDFAIQRDTTKGCTNRQDAREKARRIRDAFLCDPEAYSNYAEFAREQKILKTERAKEKRENTSLSPLKPEEKEEAEK